MSFPRIGGTRVRDLTDELPTVPPVLPLIVDVDDLDASLEKLEVSAPHRSILCLVTRGGLPMGKVRIDLEENEELTRDVVKSRLLAAMPPMGEIEPSPAAPFHEEPATRLTATVVVATRNRPEQLVECLDSILGGTAPVDCLVVVDNAPSDNKTAELMELRRQQDSRLVYVRENRPGLAHAHNAAIPHVTTEVVAFTDDDVLADSRWLEKLVQVFVDDEQAVCVTGLIAPRELDTLPQQWVEGNVTYDKGLNRRIFDGLRNSKEFPLLPYASGACGSGANMSFRISYLRRVGGFETALGTGTVAMGGDDLAAFYDVIAAGHRLVYEPAAIVLHPHHREYAALRRQVYGYGAGLGAHLMRCFLLDPRMLLALAKNTAMLRSRATRILHPPVVDGLPPYPKDLLREHRRGLLEGPWRYLRSRRQVRRLSELEGKR